MLNVDHQQTDPAHLCGSVYRIAEPTNKGGESAWPVRKSSSASRKVQQWLRPSTKLGLASGFQFRGKYPAILIGFLTVNPRLGNISFHVINSTSFSFHYFDISTIY